MIIDRKRKTAIFPGILVAIWLTGILFAMNIPFLPAQVTQVISLLWIIPFLKPWNVKELLNLPICRNRITLIAICSFFTFAFVGGLHSIFPLYSLIYLMITFIGFCICGKIWYFLDRNYLLALKIYAILGVFILSILYLTNNFLSLRNPNGLGLILLSLVASSYAFDRLLPRLTILAPSLIMLVATGSRAATIGITIVLLTQVNFDCNRSAKGKVAVLIGFFLIAIIVMAGFGFNLDSVIFGGFSNYFELDNKYTGIDSGFTGRTEVWTWGISYWLKNGFFFGSGYRVHEWILRVYNFANQSSLHNGFLGLLIETGLVGFISIMTIFKYSLSNLIRLSFLNFKLAQIGVSIILGYSFIAFFERFLISFGNPTSVLFIMFILMPYSYKNKYYKPKSEGADRLEASV